MRYISCRLYKSGPEGFSLVEVLIAIVITGVALGAIYSVFASANQTYFNQDSIADTQQRARIGLDMMVRDIRMAGLNPTVTAGAGIVEATPTKIRFTADRNMNGDLTDSNEDLTYELVGSSLVRYEGAGAPVVLIDNVSALLFTYFALDESTPLPTVIQIVPVSASDLANIRTVAISITCQGMDYKRKNISRTLQTQISCRNLSV
jgi:type IV pilus assembly protein PilW